MLPMLLYHFPLRRFLKFAITGGSALAIDMAVYILCTRKLGIPYIPSRALSLAVAVVWSFTLNRQWTFRATAGNIRQQAPRFLAVLVCTSIINLALMKFGITVLRLYDIAVILINSVIIVFINFYAHALWSYKKTDE